MPPRRQYRRKAAAKKAPVRRAARRAVRRVMNSEFASASQTLQLEDDQMNQVWKLDNINLAQFDRLVQIAQAYQFYRITKVHYKLTPYADTYQTSGFDGAGNPEPHSSVPYAYYLINKGESLVSTTFDSLRDAGSKPIRFDDKTVNINWTPAINMLTQADTATVPNYNFQLTRQSPWLTTNAAAGQSASTWSPSTVPHMGLLYGVQQDYVVGPTGYNNKYGCELTIHVQFKKPLNNPGKTGQPALVKEVVRKSEEVV